MTDTELLDEIHDDVKAIRENELPAIRERLTRMETKDAIWDGIMHSLWGIVGGVLSAFGIHVIGIR